VEFHLTIGVKGFRLGGNPVTVKRFCTVHFSITLQAGGELD